MKSRDPKTGIYPIAEWGWECARGFVSDSRFSSTDRVIKRTNRDTTRKWRKVAGAYESADASKRAAKTEP